MSACPKLSLPRGDAGSQSLSRIQGQSVIVGRWFDFICLWNFHVKGVEIQLLPANNIQQLEFLCNLYFYKVVSYRCRSLPLPFCWQRTKAQIHLILSFSLKKDQHIEGHGCVVLSKRPKHWSNGQRLCVFSVPFNLPRPLSLPHFGNAFLYVITSSCLLLIWVSGEIDELSKNHSKKTVQTVLKWVYNVPKSKAGFPLQALMP